MRASSRWAGQYLYQRTVGDGGNVDQAAYKVVYQPDSDDPKLTRMTLHGKCTDYRRLDSSSLEPPTSFW